VSPFASTFEGLFEKQHFFEAEAASELLCAADGGAAKMEAELVASSCDLISVPPLLLGR